MHEAGTHDPKERSDRLLLNLKGSLSAYELAGVRARMPRGRRGRADRRIRHLARPECGERTAPGEPQHA